MAEKPTNKTIMEVLRSIDRGQFLTDLDKSVRDIALAIEENGGGKGDITIKISMKAKAKTGSLEISADMNAKLPKRTRLDAIFYLDDDQTGDLSRMDKRQPMMPSVVDADEMNERRQRSNLRGSD